MKKFIKYSVIIVILVFVVNIVYFSLNVPNVAVISINGVITTNKADEIIKEINRAKNDSSIKAVLIKVDSPGGEACSSQRIYLALKNLSGIKPTVALIKTIGASGAYFAACGANKIVAYPTSTVGSIGVIFETINFSQLAKRLGLSLFVVKTGPVKDVGNPFRKPTEKDVKMIKNVIESIYNQFIEAVAESRNIPLNKVKKIADGSVFTGQQALKLHLVDSIGGKKAAEDYIKKLAHLKSIEFANLSENKSFVKRILNSLYTINMIHLLSQPTAKAIYQ